MVGGFSLPHEIAALSKRRSSPPASCLISPWPSAVSKDLTVPKYFMLSSFVGTRRNRRVAARRRQRWRKERLSAKNRRFRLVAIPRWGGRRHIRGRPRDI